MVQASMPDEDLNCFDNDFPLLGSLSDPPDIRSRLHVICALYAHTPRLDARLALLDSLENLALQAAHLLAVDCWRAAGRRMGGASCAAAPTTSRSRCVPAHTKALVHARPDASNAREARGRGSARGPGQFRKANAALTTAARSPPIAAWR